jgi:hypothetical protein
VFAAGTTQKVALMAYGKVELRDQRTRVAIEEALALPDAFPSQDVPPTVAKAKVATTATARAPKKKTHRAKAATKTKVARTAKVKQAPKKTKKSAAT